VAVITSDAAINVPRRAGDLALMSMVLSLRVKRSARQPSSIDTAVAM
jgi:hypothetical protein